jgi:hypothetical protein
MVLHIKTFRPRYKYIYMYIEVCIYTYMYSNTDTFFSTKYLVMYIHIFYVYVCIYIYMYICIYIYVYIYAYICTQAAPFDFNASKKKFMSEVINFKPKYGQVEEGNDDVSVGLVYMDIILEANRYTHVYVTMYI